MQIVKRYKSHISQNSVILFSIEIGECLPWDLLYYRLWKSEPKSIQWQRSFVNKEYFLGTFKKLSKQKAIIKKTPCVSFTPNTALSLLPPFPVIPQDRLGKHLAKKATFACFFRTCKERSYWRVEQPLSWSKRALDSSMATRAAKPLHCVCVVV